VNAAPAPAAAPPAPAAPWGAVADHGHVWPTPAQELLLRAALMPDERALEAWRRVRPLVDVAALDGATQALLPVLRRNLLSLGVDDELLGLFKGVHRYSWARNQMLLAPMMPIVAALERAGISTLLLKGAALVADRRLDAGVRPMNDVDVLVPRGRAGEAIDLLLENGLEPVGGVPAWYVADYAPRFVPSHGFRDELDRQLDLHWHVLHASCQPGADEAFWAAAEPIELLGVQTRALCPADELLLVVLHGLRWNAVPTYRWVVDAALLCGGAIGSVDYDRLLEQAVTRRVTVALAAGLAYLCRISDAAVPEECLRALRSARGSLFERLEFRAQTAQPRRRSRLQRELVFHGQYLRRELSLGRRASVVRHLQLGRRRLGIERVRDLSSVLGGGVPGPGRPDSEMAAAIGAGAAGVSAAPVPYGEPLELGRGENARVRTAHGTWRAEADGCWIAGREARLILPLQRPASSSLGLEISADGLFAGGRSRQRLAVRVNGTDAAALTLERDRGLRDQFVLLPREAVAGRDSLDIRLRTPDAASPAELGLDDDDRRVGVFLRRLTVREPPLREQRQAIELAEGADDENVLAGGWGEAEALGRWTVGGLARIWMRCAFEPGPRELELDAFPLSGRRGRALAVEVLIDGRRVGATRYGESPAGPSPRRFPLPGWAVGGDGELVIGLRMRGAVSPHALGLSPDRRELGLFVRRIALVAPVAESVVA
jgi:hypothetical protein